MCRHLFFRICSGLYIHILRLTCAYFGIFMSYELRPKYAHMYVTIFPIFSIFPSCCTADLRTQCLIVCADCCKAMLLMVYAAFAQQPSKAQGCAHRKKAPLNCVRYPCALSDNPQKALFVMVYAALSQQTLKIRGCAHRKKSPLSACRNGFKP